MVKYWEDPRYDDNWDNISICNIQKSYKKLMAIWIFNAFFGGAIVGYIFYWFTWVR